MLPRFTLAPLALVGALVAASPAAAAGHHHPIAHAAGGDAPAVIPSLVQTRITRTENALERLTTYVDDGDTAGVDRTGKVIRRQLAAAWRGAAYYLKNPPPPVVGDGLAFARASSVDRAIDGGAVAGAVADQYTTAGAVFQTYHDTAATIAELTDGARVPVLDSMSTTMFWTLDARDKAVPQAHTLDAPPPAEGEDPPEDAVSFATVMPTVTPMLDDEMQQIKQLQTDATDLRPGGKKLLKDALVQTLFTENTINTYWPPVGDGAGPLGGPRVRGRPADARARSHLTITRQAGAVERSSRGV